MLMEYVYNPSHRDARETPTSYTRRRVGTSRYCGRNVDTRPSATKAACIAGRWGVERIHQVLLEVQEGAAKLDSELDSTRAAVAPSDTTAEEVGEVALTTIVSHLAAPEYSI